MLPTQYKENSLVGIRSHSLTLCLLEAWHQTQKKKNKEEHGEVHERQAACDQDQSGPEPFSHEVSIPIGERVWTEN